MSAFVVICIVIGKKKETTQFWLCLFSIRHCEKAGQVGSGTVGSEIRSGTVGLFSIIEQQLKL